MKKKALTVGELRKALEGVPDDLKVQLSSDTGVDQGEGEIVIGSVRRVNYDLPAGKHFEDGSTSVDYFEIYANDTGNWDGEEDEG